MKKQILKPENWQDFESLCKMLWGEIWGIPYKIKKNGRIGQPQSGVDISGRPKGENGYWGIQCKGKDEYTHAKLTKTEIDQEILKAKNFNPKLEVFIIATTSNKDIEIEEYVRLLDIKSRSNNGFEIILFSWEDIVDLIEVNRDTYQYYIHNRQFKDKYDFDVSFDDGEYEKILSPTFHRKIRKWVLISGKIRDIIYRLPSSIPLNRFERKLDNTNTAICEFKLKMKNTGGTVIENWYIVFNLKGIHKPVNDTKYPEDGRINFSYETKQRNSVLENEIKLESITHPPFIQKHEEDFKIKIIPLPKQYDIIVEWDLRARDFDRQGSLTLKVVPIFKDEIERILVDDESELKADEIISVRENIHEIDKK